MDTLQEILLALGRIEGRLEGMRAISERVSKLEQWQAWLKGGWAAVVAMYAHLYRIAFAWK